MKFKDTYDFHIQLLRNYDRHLAVLRVLEDIEQLLSAPYDANYIQEWLTYTRRFHGGSIKQIKTRLKEVANELYSEE